MTRRVAVWLTLVTGFTALVYQVAWQKYLSVLLGSHGEATAAVLAIFLGGLSAGYALFGRFARRRGAARLLMAYGGVELAIGAYALMFPLLFLAARSLSLRVPAEPAAAGFVLDVLLAAGLIGLPAVLMGGTIPLLTQALSTGLEDATRFHALVYGCNTAGAFAGALCGGFVLVPWLGLRNVVLVMGALNLVAGALYVTLGARGSAVSRTPEVAKPAGREVRGLHGYIAVALLSGFAMMSLQTTLNRVGALALGASQLTFAMVVAVFVLCIALGSLGVSALRRIRRSYVVGVQWALVAYLLIAFPIVQDAPYWAHVLRTRFSGAGSGFYGYQLSVFVGLLAVSCVPLGLSGAILPLLFHQLRGRVGDLGNVAGRLYAWNTAGSLAGALLGGYALLFWLDLKQVFGLALIALILAAGIVTTTTWPARRTMALGAMAASIALLLIQPPWSAQRLSSGVFRHRAALPMTGKGADAFFESYTPRGVRGRLVFYDDDPIASVAVYRSVEGQGAQALVINGKSDGDIPGDNLTTGLLALLPALFADEPRRAFVVGYGTGMTAGVLGALDSIQEVVVAEISRGVLAAAELFESLNHGALRNPKTRIVRSDAYRALLRSAGTYDVIVSEPSNPWVTGVEMLYSREFLEAVRDRLSPGGVFAQWFHTYETDERTVALVLRTCREAFEHLAVWSPAESDLVILGFRDSRPDDELDRLRRRFERPDFRTQLELLSIDSFPELLAHELLPVGVVGAMELPGELHTILHPRLSHSAARAFYAGGQASLPVSCERRPAEVGARNSLWRRLRRGTSGPIPWQQRSRMLSQTCRFVGAWPCATLFAEWRHEEPASVQLGILVEAARRERKLDPRLLDGLAPMFGGEVTASARATYESALAFRDLFLSAYHHAAPFHARPLHEIWRRCSPDPRCEAQLEPILQIGLPYP